MNQNKSSKKANCGCSDPSCANDAPERQNRTPRNSQNISSGQVQQYDPNDSVLAGNEQSRQPRILRTSSYETHSGTIETFRQGQQQRRQPGPTDMNISDLPEECLADMSPPGFDLSMELPSSVNGTNGECLEDVSAPSMIDECKTRCDNENNGYMDCLYNEISGRFKQLTDKMRYRGSEPECLDNSGNNEEETLPCAQQNEIINQASACCLAEMLANQSIPSLLESRLEDESMPCGNESNVLASRSPNRSLEDSRQQQQHRSSPRRQQQMSMTLPTQNLWDVSAPSMANSTRDETKQSQRSRSCGRCRRYATAFNNSMGRPRSSTCIGEMYTAMPSGSRSTRGKSLRREQFPMQSSRRGQMTNECLEDMTMPTFADVSGTSRDRTLSKLQRCMINECLDEITMPSYPEVSGASRNRSRGPQNRSRTMECLDEMTMPSFADDSAASRNRSRGPQNRSQTMECLDEMTMPSFAGISGSSKRRSRGPQNRSRTMECLDEMTMPSYAGVSGASRNRSRGTQNRSQTMECLDEMTMPSYPEVSGASRYRSRGPQNRSQTMECLDEMTMPSYPEVSGASRRSRGSQNRSQTMECLDEMTMPPYADVSDISRNRSRGSQNRNLPFECLDEVTMPSFADDSGASRNRSRGPQNRSQTMECLDDMTMPSFAGVSGSSKRRSRGPQNRSLTKECLDEMTMPSLAELTGTSRGRTLNQMQRCMINKCLEKITIPSFEDVPVPSRRKSTGQSQNSRTNECLEDMTMPSYEEVSRGFRACGPYQRSVGISTDQCLENMTIPSFGSSGRNQTIYDRSGESPRNSGMTDERLEDITMPSFAGVYGSSRRGRCCNEGMGMTSSPRQRSVSYGGGRRLQPRFWATATIINNSLQKANTSGATSRRGPRLTDECLDDVSMPQEFLLSHNASKSVSRRAPDISYPSQQLADESAPRRSTPGPQQQSFRNQICNDTGGRLEDVTMPSFQDEPSYQLYQVTISSERLEDISDPCHSQFDDENEGFDGSEPPVSSTRSEKPQAKSSPRKADKSQTETKTVSKKSITSKQQIDKNALSSMKDASSQVNPDVMQVTVSKSTVTRTYNNADRPGNSSGPAMIEDISMPSFESLTQSHHGASSMDNYAPCDDLMQNTNSTANECQPACPEKVRAQSKRSNHCKDGSPSQKQPKRKHC